MLPYALAVSPPARAQIRAALIRRTEAYAQVFIGVGYYLLHALARAELHLRRALARAPTPAVAALLRLLLGNIADQQGHTEIASRDYSLATHDTTIRRRAQLGLADVQYQVGHKHCRPGEPSLSLLSSARHGFSVALRAYGGIAAARAGSALAAKAAFGMGQVDLCLSAAGQTRRWLATRKEFTATIAAYRPILPELRDDAAEAHAGLGLDYLSVEQAPAAYEDARREYSAAADLTTLNSRRAYFDGAIGFADAHLHQYSVAVAMYEQGARLAAGTALGRSSPRGRKNRRPGRGPASESSVDLLLVCGAAPRRWLWEERGDRHDPTLRRKRQHHRRGPSCALYVNDRIPISNCAGPPPSSDASPPGGERPIRIRRGCRTRRLLWRGVLPSDTRAHRAFSRT